METAVCHKETVRGVALAFALGWAAAIAVAQGQPDWRKVGPSTAELALASPATGPVDRVWFSPQGSTLYALTRSGHVFQTADFETWSPALRVATPSADAAAEPVRSPEAGARIVAGGSDWFALGRNLYRSHDGGRSWENLTAFISQPVIGAGQKSVAVSPLDANQVVVANEFGVWRTLDGGLTWAGLNESLPNLLVRRILSTPSGGAGMRVQVEGWSESLELPPGGDNWEPVPAPELDAEAALREQLSVTLKAEITAVASSGDAIYAGSADGRLWFSNDGARTFGLSRLARAAAGGIERIFVDGAQPRVALAAVGGEGSRVMRTFNGGDYWDAIDSDLPDGAVHSVAADVVKGAVYVATSKGVFWTITDLLAAASAPHWTAMGDGLPAEPVFDARLDPAGVRLYVAVDGYGVYATAAPHLRRSLQVVSAADRTVRAAAPGALLSVVGARVNAARCGDQACPVLGIPTDTESQIQVPYGASGATVDLALETATGQVRIGLPMQPASPAIFVGLDGAAMVYDAQTDLPLDARRHAHSGGRIQVFASGLGRVRPDWPAGVATPLTDAPAVVAPVGAYLNGVPVRVTQATLAPGYVGFYLVEVQLPAISNFGSAELHLSVSGQVSNSVQIVVEP